MDLSSRTNRVIFFFITWIGGIFGIHWFVQRNYKKGLLYLLTFGGFMFCWFYDWVITLINIFSYKEERFPIQQKHRHINKTTQFQDNTNTYYYSQQEKQIAEQTIQTQMEYFSRILTDVQCGFKNLDPYLSRYQILLNTYKDIEDINNRFNLRTLPVTLNELHTVFINELNSFIKNKILITLDIHSIDNDENKVLKKDLMKIRKEIIEGKHAYPEFAQLLENLQVQLEGEINKL